MPYDPTNIFARILRGEIPARKILETEHALAFHDIGEKAPTHALVIPKGAYMSFTDFSHNATDAEIIGFTRAVGEVVRMLGADANGYRLIANAGAHAHQEVPHYHVHILAGKPLGPMLSEAM